MTNSVKNIAASNTISASLSKAKALHWGAFAFLFHFFFPGLVFGSECQLDQADDSATVAYVIDADTIQLDDGRRVRFTAINSPERANPKYEKPGEPLADEASALTKKLLPENSQVTLKYESRTTDRYNRTLAHVFNEKGVNVQEELLRKGLAAHVASPPNLWHAECYQRQQQYAISARKGIWALPYFSPSLTNIAGRKTGFYRVTFLPDRLLELRSAIILASNDGSGLRISRDDLVFFDGYDFEKFIGKRIYAQGWVYPGKKGFMMRIRHPLMLQNAEDQSNRPNGN